MPVANSEIEATKAAAAANVSALIAVSVTNEPKLAVAETAISADTLAAATAFVASITELATGTDVITARPFWEVIDDTQDANWQNIGNTQTAGWTAVATT